MAGLPSCCRKTCQARRRGVVSAFRRSDGQAGCHRAGPAPCRSDTPGGSIAPDEGACAQARCCIMLMLASCFCQCTCETISRELPVTKVGGVTFPNRPSALRSDAMEQMGRTSSHQMVQHATCTAGHLMIALVRGVGEHQLTSAVSAPQCRTQM